MSIRISILNNRRGFFYYHIGWIFKKLSPKIIQKLCEADLRDIMADPIVVFQNKLITYVFFHKYVFTVASCSFTVFYSALITLNNKFNKLYVRNSTNEFLCIYSCLIWKRAVCMSALMQLTFNRYDSDCNILLHFARLYQCTFGTRLGTARLRHK
jgi:hypothetical protein